MSRSMSLTRSATLVAILAMLAALLIATPASAATVDLFVFSGTTTPRTITLQITPASNRAHTFTELYQPQANGVASTVTGDAPVATYCRDHGGPGAPASVTFNLSETYRTGVWTVRTRSHQSGTEGGACTGGNPGDFSTSTHLVTPNLATGVTQTDAVAGALIRYITTTTNVNDADPGASTRSDAEDAKLTGVLDERLDEKRYCVVTSTVNCTRFSHYTDFPNQDSVEVAFERVLVDAPGREVRFLGRVPSNFDELDDTSPITSTFTPTQKLGAGASSGGGSQEPIKSADLRLSMTRTNNGGITWTATIVNRGPSDVPDSNVAVNATGVSGLQHGFFADGSCSATEATGASINTGALDRDETRTLCFTGQPDNGMGNASLELTVNSAISDPVPSNNVASK